MKYKVSIPERLKDLRTERHLTLEELESIVDISKSALGSYEADDDSSKEISHKNILKLAGFYQVSTDYLLCLTDNRNPENTEFTELHINDEMAELLKSGRINNRLLCEIAAHERFFKLLADAEIYVDGIATMRLRDLNMSLEDARALVTGEDAGAAVNRALDTLEAGIIDEEDFFCHLTHKHWDTILHDIRKIHEKDSGSVPDITPTQEIIVKVRKALMSPGDSIGKLTQIFCESFGVSYKRLSEQEKKVLRGDFQESADGSKIPVQLSGTETGQEIKPAVVGIAIPATAGFHK